MIYNSKNQLTKRVNKQGKTYNYKYDKNGNILSDGDKSYTYTSFNKVKTITLKDNQTITFMYDGFNNLVKKIEPTKSTYYIDKEYEYVTTTVKTPTKSSIPKLSLKEEFKHNIYANNQLVAVHVKTLIDNTKQVDKTAYIHKDSQGSTNIVTNSQAKVVLINRYEPFGGLLYSIDKDKEYNKEDIRGYTNHRQLYTLNLIDMGGRMYDTTISRFLSIDPHLQDPTNPQNYNRYIYVLNNPLRYTDPSGYNWDDEHNYDASQSSYDAGAASDAQAQENDEQRDSGYNGGDGSASQTTTPVSVFNPPKSTTPTISAPKEYDYTQTTKIDTSLSDSYFGEQLNSSWGDSEPEKEKPSILSRIWSGLTKSLKTLNNKKGKIGQDISIAFSKGKQGVSDMLVNAPSYAKAPLGVAMAITTGPFAEALATGTVAYGYTHPSQVAIGAEIVVGALTPGPPNTASKYESLGFGLGNLFDYLYGE